MNDCNVFSSQVLYLENCGLQEKLDSLTERLDRESIVTVGQDRYGDRRQNDDDNENDQKWPKILSLQKSGSWLRGCGWADIDKYKIYHKLGIQGKASESESQKRRKKSKCDVGNLSITCMGIRILKHWSSAFWGFILREITKLPVFQRTWSWSEASIRGFIHWLKY